MAALTVMSCVGGPNSTPRHIERARAIIRDLYPYPPPGLDGQPVELVLRSIAAKLEVSDHAIGPITEPLELAEAIGQHIAEQRLGMPHADTLALAVFERAHEISERLAVTQPQPSNSHSDSWFRVKPYKTATPTSARAYYSQLELDTNTIPVDLAAKLKTRSCDLVVLHDDAAEHYLAVARWRAPSRPSLWILFASFDGSR